MAASMHAANPSLGPDDCQDKANRLIFSLLALKHIEALKLSALSGCPPSNISPETGLIAQRLRPVFEAYDRIFSIDLFTDSLTPEVNLSDEALQRPLKELLAWEHPLSLGMLAYLFENLANRNHNKKEGIFYTPLPIVKRMVKSAAGQAIKRHRSPEAASILDPACGSGIFLLEAARLLFQMRAASTPSGKLALLKDSIFGVDKDPRAASVTRLLLVLSLFEDRQRDLFPQIIPDLRANIHCGNSLLDTDELERLEAAQINASSGLISFSWGKAFPSIMSQGGFDCIIGNPPYGLSRGDQIGPEENEKLKLLYKDYRSGKINKYLVFMAKSYRLLGKHGILSFIVPNAWLGIRGGKAMRRLLVQEKTLESLTIFRCKVFEGPGVEAVIFRVDKGQRHDFIKVRHDGAIDGAHALKSFRLPIGVCRQRPDYQIPASWSQETGEVLRQIDALSFPLGDPASPFVPSIALQAYALGKGCPPQSREMVRQHIYHCRDKQDESCHPYLEGSGVQRYKINWSGLYLKHGPWLAEPQVLERFCGARIVVREVLNAPPYCVNAALLEDTMLYNKSVLHIRPRQPLEKDAMWALLAILNSKLASFVIRQRGRKSQRRLFPKLVNDDLKDFPLPKDFFSCVPDLCSQARRLAGFTGAPAEAASLQSSLDKAVYSVYGLKDSHVKILEESFEN